MKTGKVKVLLLSMLFCVLSVTAGATVVTFEDLILTLPDVDYAGFHWNGIEHLMTDAHYMDSTDPETGNTYGAPSPVIAVTNYCGGGLIEVTSSTAFDFNGAYFSSWAHNDVIYEYGVTTIIINGYDNLGNLIGTVTSDLLPSYNFITANFSDVYRVEFVPTESNHWFLMDNFTYNEPQKPVPEPATMLLLGTSLLGVRVFRKKIKR